MRACNVLIFSIPTSNLPTTGLFIADPIQTPAHRARKTMQRPSSDGLRFKWVKCQVTYNIYKSKVSLVNVRLSTTHVVRASFTISLNWFHTPTLRVFTCSSFSEHLCTSHIVCMLLIDKQPYGYTHKQSTMHTPAGMPFVLCNSFVLAIFEYGMARSTHENTLRSWSCS